MKAKSFAPQGFEGCLDFYGLKPKKRLPKMMEKYNPKTLQKIIYDPKFGHKKQKQIEEDIIVGKTWITKGKLQML